MNKTSLLMSLIIVLVSLTFFSTEQTLNAQSVKAEFVFCAAGDLICESNNRVRQDKVNAPYVDRIDGVEAVFYSGGSRDLTISLTGSRTRTLRLDFRDVAYYGNPQPSWWNTSPQQNVKPFINVLEAYKAKELCVPDASGTCNYNFVTRMNCGLWKAAGDTKTEYKLQWNPTSIQPFINTPETTSEVNVNYIKDSNGEVFIITPLPNASSGRIIAGLQSTLSRTDKAAGQYVMPFNLTVRFK